LGGSAVFWQCASGTFYNLYDRYWAEQCEPALIVALPCGGDGNGAGGAQSGGVSETTVGTEVVTTTMVVPLSDGQPQVVTTTSVVYICQIGDGGSSVFLPPFPHFLPDHLSASLRNPKTASVS
jgi:hypothetical protein